MTRAEKKKFVIQTLTQVQFEVMARQSMALMDHNWTLYNLSFDLIRRIGDVKNRIKDGIFPLDVLAAMDTILKGDDEAYKQKVDEFAQRAHEKRKEETT